MADKNSIDFERKLIDMLSLVPNDVDKREGSIIYSTLAPVAFFLSMEQTMLSWFGQNLFLDTAEGDYLDRVLLLTGINRKQATKAIKQINTYDSNSQPLDVPIGSRFGVNNLTYKLIEKISTGKYKAECEQTGINGNAPVGDILPIDNINNLGSAEILGNPLISARDEESDESVRDRAIAYIRETPFGGNKASYKIATLEIDGVGECRVFGANETQTPQKIVLMISDEQGNKASQELISKVQALYDTNNPETLAPVGADVTVSTSSDLAINVTGKIKVKTGESFEVVKPIVEGAIRNYIENISFTDDIVYYAKLITEMLNSNSAVVDIQNVTMNALSENVTLIKSWDNYQVPTVGTITLSEVV